MAGGVPTEPSLTAAAEPWQATRRRWLTVKPADYVMTPRTVDGWGAVLSLIPELQRQVLLSDKPHWNFWVADQSDRLVGSLAVYRNGRWSVGWLEWKG